MESKIKTFTYLRFRRPVKNLFRFKPINIQYFRKFYPKADPNSTKKNFDLIIDYYENFIDDSYSAATKFWRFVIFHGYYKKYCLNNRSGQTIHPFITKLILLGGKNDQQRISIIKDDIEKMRDFEKLVYQEIFDEIVNKVPRDKVRFLRKIMNEYISLQMSLARWGSSRNMSAEIEAKIRFYQEIISDDQYW